jgi:hypothetical protein
LVYGIYYAIPHLEWFDVRELIIHNWELRCFIDWLAWIGATIYAIVYTGMLLGCAWLVFPSQDAHAMIRLVLLFLFVCCATLATILDPDVSTGAAATASANFLVALMGDSRRLFAHEFFAMADAYFHSGFYPTIFDTPKGGNKSDLVEESHSKTGRSRGKH